MKKLVTLLTTSVLSFNAMAGMVVVGNISGVDSLTQSDVQKLFLGKSTKLSNGSNARIIELTDGAAGRIAFHKIATGRSEAQVQSTWSRLVFTGKAEAPIQVADYITVISTVVANPTAIGYVDESALTTDVKVLYKF